MFFAKVAALVAVAAIIDAVPLAAPVPAPVPIPGPLALPITGHKVYPGYRQFNLQTEVQGQDNSDANNLYISTFHIGAGLNAAVGTSNTSLATPLILKDDLIQFEIPQEGYQPMLYGLGLSSFTAPRSDAPPSYKLVQISVVNYTTGWDIANNYVERTAPDFSGFSMCFVNGTWPYDNLGSQYQLFWKDNSSVPKADNCADVKLKTLYLD